MRDYVKRVAILATVQTKSNKDSGNSAPSSYSFFFFFKKKDFLKRSRWDIFNCLQAIWLHIQVKLFDFILRLTGLTELLLLSINQWPAVPKTLKFVNCRSLIKQNLSLWNRVRDTNWRSPRHHSRHLHDWADTKRQPSAQMAPSVRTSDGKCSIEQSPSWIYFNIFIL